jgi:hypothetical protein
LLSLYTRICPGKSNPYRTLNPDPGFYSDEIDTNSKKKQKGDKGAVATSSSTARELKPAFTLRAHTQVTLSTLRYATSGVTPISNLTLNLT